MSDKLYMSWANSVANESKCNKAKVGAVLIKGLRCISYGYNGTAPGECNDCEDAQGNTLPDVVHAEDNCYSKLISSTETAIDSTLYVTLAPCKRCAHLIVRAGTVRVVYLHNPKAKMEGIYYLLDNNVIVEQFIGI